MKSLLPKKAQRGYSLIELSIALAIIGVVIAGSIIGVQAILRSNNVNKTIAQTNLAVNKIVGKLLRDNSYVNANTVNLTRVGQEVWSTADIISGGQANAQVTHPLSGFVTVQPLSALTENVAINQGYVYTLTAVPVAACADLAVGLESLAYVLQIQNAAPPAAAFTVPTGTIVKDPSTPFNSATANNACAGNGAANPGDQANISFLVPRR